MSRDLWRLLRPSDIAVIGGGAWCDAVAAQARSLGFQGPVRRVHPKGGAGVFTRIEDLPAPPDAAFIGINRHATIEAVAALSRIGAGGATCFASGFSEAEAEDAEGRTLQARLLSAAGEMPILGPNCYGFINALDGALLWPDQHGCGKVARGVAILAQSSNIAVNLTMQNRALPIAYLVTCGNMAQTAQAEIALSLLEDDRVSAIGLHVEGFSDLRAWEALAHRAHARKVPLVALKVGRSAQAQSATVSHTASLAGGDAGAAALLRRLGIARVDSLPVFLETLKLLHMSGPLASNRLASISCSGGEASLAADLAHPRAVEFPPLNARQKSGLRAALGPRVALSNPLDYHTYIWRDTARMAEAWAAMVDPELALTLLIVDYPRSDICDASDWQCASDAALMVRARTGANIAMVASLPELMPEPVARQLMAGGVVPFSGLDEALAAAEAAASIAAPLREPVLLPGAARTARLLDEAAAKARLAGFGLDLPRGKPGTDPSGLRFPVVLKGVGFAHKSEAGAVALNLANAEAVAQAARAMGTGAYLVEEMITGAVAELLVGVTRDPAHGFVLTLAAGGVLTELLADSASLLLPASRDEVARALGRLRIAPVLRGYRGAPAASTSAILDAVGAVQAYVLANADRVEEVEINPLICTKERAVAADALIREAPNE